MNTKLNMGVIEDKSITYSKLADDVAESITAILTDSAPDWNTGEGGSGDGALRVIVPELSMIGMYFIEEGMITEEMVDEKLTEMEGGAAGNEPFIRMMRAYKEIFAHNAEVFAAIVEKAKKGEGCMVLLDQSPLLKVYCDIMLETEPEIAEMVDAYAMSCSQVANANLLYADIKPEYESSYGGDQMSLILAPVHANPDITMCPIYPSNMVVGVMPDGSLAFRQTEEEQPSSGSEVVTFYVLGGGAVQDDTTKAMNKKSYDAFWAYDGLPAVNILVFVSESNTKNDGFEAMYPIAVAGVPNEDLILQTSAFLFTISSDGNIVLSDIPTA